MKRSISLLTLAALGGCLDTPDALGPDDDVPPDGAAGWATIEGPMGRMQVPYVVIDGMAVWEGDIVLGPAARIDSPVFGGAAHKTLGRRWTHGTVRYRYDASVTSAARTNIEEVLAYVEARVPALDFVNIGASESGNYLEYRAQAYDANDSRGGWADQIGMNGGEQSVTFNGQPSSDDDQGLILHETLHAVGLFHEQSRPDRDDFVKVDYDCIDWSFWPWENSQLQYEIKGDALGLGPYDFASVMHYQTGAFCQQDDERPAKCDLLVDTNDNGVPEAWCATVTKLGNPTNPIIRPRSDLSVEDVNTLFRMYEDSLGVNQADEHLGAAVAVGDFDNDGYDDLAVGMPDEDYGAEADVGQVYVFRGTSARLVPWQVLGQSYVGGSIDPGDHFGAALAAADLDGDGFDDLLIGMPGEDVLVGGVNKVDAGAAAIFRGTADGLVGSELWTQATDGAGTPDTHDRFGTAVAIGTIGGVPTAVIGAPGDRNPVLFGGGTTASGAVFLFPHDFPSQLFLGNPTRLAYFGGTGGDDFGATLAVGRLDDDTIADLAIGAPGRQSDAGTVYLYRGLAPDGPSTTWPADAMATYAHKLTQPSSAAGNRFGAALAIGNVRGGTRGELVVGAPGTTSAAGAALVYQLDTMSLGATVMTLAQTLTQAQAPSSASEAGDEFGAAIALGNYHTATAQLDLAIGAPGEDTDAGAVTFYTGGTTAAAAVITHKQTSFLGGTSLTNERFGQSLAFGHLNASGEGITNDDRNNNLFRNLDLAAGAPGDAPEVGFSGAGYLYDAPGAGSVYTFLGTGTHLLASRSYHQEREQRD